LDMGQAVELAPAPAEAQQPLSQNLCWLMSQASYTYTTEVTAALETLGIGPRAQHVLATAMTGEHTQTELARLVGLDKTTMVVTLDELEVAGLAERRPAPGDRRARVIVVTEAGAEKVREGEEIVHAVEERVLGALSAERREIFLDALNRLVAGPLAEPCACSHPPRRRAPRA
jgi:MarR family transcriptional regulator, transcriptional regulator for hemolysin